MNYSRALISLSCLFLLLACGDKTANSIATSADKSASTPKIANPFEHQLNALKKAKNVESLLQEAADNKFNAIDKLSN